ncbi:hypothetical protein V3C99_003730, partial [Haemonchus contortus]
GRVSVPRTIRGRTRPYETLSDVEFRKDYRFSRHVFFQICEMVAPDLTHGRHTTDLPVADQVAIAIHLLGRNVMQSDSARIAGCHQSTVSRVLMAFVNAINRRAARFINWPDEQEGLNISNSFYQKYGLPGITGIIDGTHCRIQKPKYAERDYICRKGYHSLNVGIVVDYEMKIRWVCAKWPGSAHDSRVFKTSLLYEQLKRGEVKGVLIGDSAYAAETFLLKPLNTTRTRQEERYNRAICSARVLVEQAFGILKRQFHILHAECRYSPAKVARIIVACCVLRNIAINRNEPTDFDDYTGEDQQGEEVPSEASHEVPERSAISFRDDLISRYF